VSFVYDAGVLIAAERNDRSVWAEHTVRLQRGRVPVTTAPVVAQVSRSPRQVQLHRFLRGCDVVPFTAEQAHEVGALLTAAGTTDVVDGHLMIVACGLAAIVLTADPDDLTRLASCLDEPVTVQAV
jgi:hypothetical protein